MVYELDCEGTRLAVTILETDESEPCQVGAGIREDGAPPALEAHGASRGDALRAVGEAWSQAGYAQVDWDAVRQALAAVRAV